MIYGNKFLNYNVLNETKSVESKNKNIVGTDEAGYIKINKKIDGINISLLLIDQYEYTGHNDKYKNMEYDELIEYFIDGINKSYNTVNENYKKVFKENFLKWMNSNQNYPDITEKELSKISKLYAVTFYINKDDTYEYTFCYENTAKKTNQIYEAAEFTMILDKKLKLIKVICTDT